MVRLTKYIPDESLSVLIENEFPADKFIFSEKIILHFKCDNFQNRSQWKLYESNGRLLKSGLINQKEVMIKTEDISNGIYFL